MKTIQEFYAWERSSRDTIDVKTIYIDIADDLVAGILLSQIIYWYLPNREGQSKLKIYKDNRWWIAKGREDWWEETRITPKQFDRAIHMLEEKQIVITHVYQFGSKTLKHVSLNEDILLTELNIQLDGKSRFNQRVNPELPKGEIPFSPNVKSGLAQKSNPVSTEGELPISPKVESGFPLLDNPYTKTNEQKKTKENDYQSVILSNSDRSTDDYPEELKAILVSSELEAFEDGVQRIMSFAIEDLYFSVGPGITEYPLSIIRRRMCDICYPVLALAWGNYCRVRENSGITNHRSYLVKCIWSALIEMPMGQESAEDKQPDAQKYIRINQQIDYYIIENFDQNMIVSIDSYPGLPFGRILKTNNKQRLVVFWDRKSQYIKLEDLNSKTS